MEIRSLQLPDDIDALSRLETTSTSTTVLNVVATPAGLGLTEVGAPAPIVKNHQFVADLTDPQRPWTDGYVAVEGGDVVGFAATVYHEWNRRQVLWHLYVARGHRGAGFGRALLERVLDVARFNGARHLWLETQNTNASAVKAYLAMGFQLVGLDSSLYDGANANETALYLAKSLTLSTADG